MSDSNRRDGVNGEAFDTGFGGRWFAGAVAMMLVIVSMPVVCGAASFELAQAQDHTEKGEGDAEADKTKSTPERVAGIVKKDFVPLFSEENLKQWRQCGPGRFLVTNGVATGEGGMGLWWYAGRQFTNFVLQGEFIQEQDIADSGVFLRFPDPKKDPWNAVNQGHEMEIGDPEPKDATWRTGSIYPFQASTRANTKPPGQWNEYEIICVGQNYTVRMNGELITTWTDPKKRTVSGYIGLQNYNDGKTVRHRNLKIKELP